MTTTTTTTTSRGFSTATAAGANFTGKAKISFHEPRAKLIVAQNAVSRTAPEVRERAEARTPLHVLHYIVRGAALELSDRQEFTNNGGANKKCLPRSGETCIGMYITRGLNPWGSSRSPPGRSLRRSSPPPDSQRTSSIHILYSIILPMRAGVGKTETVFRRRAVGIPNINLIRNAARNAQT